MEAIRTPKREIKKEGYGAREEARDGCVLCAPWLRCVHVHWIVIRAFHRIKDGVYGMCKRSGISENAYITLSPPPWGRLTLLGPIFSNKGFTMCSQK